MIGDLEIVGEITLSGNDIPFETNSDDGNRHRSITPDIPIIATLCGNNLVEINFFAAVGEVEITITQDGVPVYTSSENITTSILKNIQLSSDVTGAFLMEITGLMLMDGSIYKSRHHRHCYYIFIITTG